MSKRFALRVHLFTKNALKVLMLLFLLSGCREKVKRSMAEDKTSDSIESGISLIILGTVQDAGSPHIACKKDCCANLFENPDPNRKVVSLGVIDHQNQQSFLFEATPDITDQVKLLKRNASWEAQELPDGIFLTHAHIGHYSGLIYLGKEGTNATGVPTYVMPKMKTYLEENGPWSQLVTQSNIDLHPIENGTMLSMNSNLKVIPLQVPHRDEFSETVGYKIIGPKKSALFIPDIDKWEKWKTNIINVIKTVDYAFLDATFYDGDELNTRDISHIPHPFVIESMELFNNLSFSEKKKIHFIHFNHTNALLDLNSDTSKTVLKKGFNIAQFKQHFEL